MSFSAISSILNNTVKQQKGLSAQVTAALACEEFDKIVRQKWGEKGANKVKALYLKDGVLTIASLSSVMAQEIKLNEREILAELKTKFGGAVERIRYVI
ncbi:MAG: DciA family protein [Patescibacteria group bacterium]|nr:DciA family protein [Patescibacteria group bacterium]